MNSSTRFWLTPFTKTLIFGEMISFFWYFNKIKIT